MGNVVSFQVLEDCRAIIGIGGWVVNVGDGDRGESGK
jgi:hypothetical protein